MPLSRNILKLLRWLEENGEAFDPEYFKAIIGGPDGEYLKEEHAENPEDHQGYLQMKRFLRESASVIVKSKWQPAEDFVENLETFFALISQKTDDDPLDEYLTETALEEIPLSVVRLKKLRAVRLRKTPGKEASNYFKQAVACYVCGLYNAVGVLSRSVLEFALREILAEQHLLPSKSNGHGEGSIRDLINWAEKAKLLSSGSIQSAHEIRKSGNKVHTKGISEREALESISLTLEVLTQIYGKSGRAPRKA